MARGERHSGASPGVQRHVMKVLQTEDLTVRRAARVIASVTLLVTVAGGVLIHFADRKNFPNIGDGLWWAIQTVTTVGYGDLVPTTAAGRFVASVVMLTGIGFLTVITAAITSTFIEAARRRVQQTRTDPVGAQLAQISARLDLIEAGLSEIARREQGSG